MSQRKKSVRQTRWDEEDAAAKKTPQARAALKRTATKVAEVKAAEIRTMYARILAHATAYKDGQGNTNHKRDLKRIAFDGLRSEVHAMLQELHPAPDPHPADEGDAELHWTRQRNHGARLWRQADTLIANAGVSAKGVK